MGGRDVRYLLCAQAMLELLSAVWPPPPPQPDEVTHLQSPTSPVTHLLTVFCSWKYGAELTLDAAQADPRSFFVPAMFRNTVWTCSYHGLLGSVAVFC